MATQVQTARGAASGFGPTVAWGSGTTLGNLLVAVVLHGGGADEGPGTITGYTLVSHEFIDGGGNESIQVFAKIAGAGDASPQYVHSSSLGRAIHMHIVEFSDLGQAGGISTAESVASYNHDTEATLDNSAWVTGPLTGTGLMIWAYVCNGTTNSSGWTLDSDFTLLAQPLNNQEGSIVGWKDSAAAESPSANGGNGRSGISTLTNVQDAAGGGGRSWSKRGRIQGWN